MSSVTASGLPEQRFQPGRPRWWPLIWGTAVGYLRAYLYLLLFWVVGWFALGIDVRARKPGPGWPFETDGVWSVVAGAAVVVPMLVVASLCIRGSVAKRIGLPVSASWVFAALFVSYYGLAALGGDWGGQQGAIVLASAVLVRLVAINRQPLWKLVGEAIPLTLRRPLVIGAAALIAAIFLAGAAYAVTHPLARGGSGGASFSGSTVQYGYSIRNGALAGLSVIDVRLRAANTSRFVVAGFRKGFDGQWLSKPGKPARVSMPRYSERMLLLTLRAPCPSTGLVPAPEGVEMTYRLLGRTFRQFVRLDEGDRSC